MNDPPHSKQRNHMITAKHIAELTRLGTNLVWFGGSEVRLVFLGWVVLCSLVLPSRVETMVLMILTKRQINRHFGAGINLFEQLGNRF